MGNLPDIEAKRIIDEASVLTELKHPNIIQLISHWYSQEKQTLIFITELLKGGTLKQYLSKIRSPNLGVIKKWCSEILKGLDYLHSFETPILHRDLKCDNIFINSTTGEIRIGDLGLSCKLKTKFTKSIVGTPEFMSPEIYLGEYNQKCDIYAYGMTVLEMVTNSRPYCEFETPFQIYQAVTTGQPPKVVQDLDNKSVRDFISLCIGNVKNRPTAKELLDHEFDYKQIFKAISS